MLASLAFLASAAATLPLQDAILARSVHGEEDPAMRSAILVWTKISQSPIPANALKHVQKAWDSPVTASVNQKILADQHNTSIDAARLRAVASEHAGDWLHAEPITAVGLRLSDEAIRVAVGHRLGSTTCQHHTCICGVAVDAKGLHRLSCRKISPRQIRHAQLNDIVWRAVKTAQYPAVKTRLEYRVLTARGQTEPRSFHGQGVSQWCGTSPSLTPTPTRTLPPQRKQHRRRQTEQQTTRRRSTENWQRPNNLLK